ncbi:hypothetical protein, partial [Klebsiella pneumoniae]|uniref:hypothetical protein n=1 Tax=Klebsiella pneumoniae TaxID=573 RepID=UPI00405595A6
GNTTTRLLGTFQMVDYVFIVGAGSIFFIDCVWSLDPYYYEQLPYSHTINVKSYESCSTMFQY